MIQRVVGSLAGGQWLGGRLVVGSGVQVFNKKKMSGVVILPMHFGRGLLCYSNFDFFYIGDKEETNLIHRSSHSNL